MKISKCLAIVAVSVLAVSCDFFQTEPEFSEENETVSECPLPEVARLIADLPMQQEQLREVHNAVCSSSENGYDEEYLMKDLFNSPGNGVGDVSGTKASTYSCPMRELIRSQLESKFRTKAGLSDARSVEEYIEKLIGSGTQIYWPYSENWNGQTLPILTFDPENSSSTNKGYEIVLNPDGSRDVIEVEVDEAMAEKRPVWVINRNDDSSYKSLEMRRKEDPDWGRGGEIDVSTKASSGFHTLILKQFKMKRNYDSWFGGASEFFIKMGGVNGFKAKTEEEMRNYQPSVTDFMVVVRRGQKDKPVPFNTIVVSNWTDQMEDYAFLITEDDGGTTTNWKCSATVKVMSKSYGFDLDIPYKDKDDIVWRGSLAREYLEKYNGKYEKFGDVELMFEIR